jgi:hypothetical protein
MARPSQVKSLRSRLRVATEECVELLAEVKHLDLLSRSLKEVLEQYMNYNVASMRRVNELRDEAKALVDAEKVLRDHVAILKDLNRIQDGIIRKRDATILELRSEIEQHKARVTVGGIPKPYTPDWSPNPSPGKFDGAGPPPYEPAIPTGVITSE